MSFLDFLFPRKCAGCGKSGTYFCPSCVAAAKLHFPQVCPVCERGALDGVKHKWCWEPYSLDGLTAIWSYEGVPKKLILKLKYKFVLDLASDLAFAASQVLSDTERVSEKSPKWKSEKFTIVPVPLHWTRENWRGFNHTEELAKLIAERLGWEARNFLVRTKRTKSQVGLKGKDRRRNVEGAFALNPNITLSQYPSVLLFDDVWTTGATIRQATKTLKKSGFRKVWCLILAGR